jgi:hypothetical protein
MIVLLLQTFVFAQDSKLKDSLPNSLFIQDTFPLDTSFQDTIPQDSTPSPNDTFPSDTSQSPAPSDTIQQSTSGLQSSADTVPVPPRIREVLNERSMEIGLMFGEPTGVSYKYYITDVNAIDAGAAVSFIPNAVFQLSADFLRHYYHFANVGEGRLPLVYGAGLAVQFRENTRFGIRIPVGLTYIMQNLPLALFIDLSPRFDIVPDTEVSINAAVGVRYRFFPR